MSDPVLVVGAGMSGLTAARMLVGEGLEVVLVDKGRAPGGRMATRTVGEARFDHGAQHFSTRAPSFRRAVEGWVADGLVSRWFESPSVTNPHLGAEPRHAVTGGMRRLPEHLAEGLDVRTATHVTTIRARDGAAVVEIGDRELRGSAVIATPPLPQLLALLDDDVLLPSGVRQTLAGVEYEACIAVMADLDGPSGLEDGHWAGDGPVVAWMGDNHHKGTSAVPAVTIHSAPEFARERLGDPPDRWVADLCRAAGPLLDGSITGAIGHRWALSRPTTVLDEGAVVAEGPVPVVLAGEVFAGARVEGAFLSGEAAARAVLERR